MYLPFKRNSRYYGYLGTTLVVGRLKLRSHSNQAWAKLLASCFIAYHAKLKPSLNMAQILLAKPEIQILSLVCHGLALFALCIYVRWWPAKVFWVCLISYIMWTTCINDHANPWITPLDGNNVPRMRQEIQVTPNKLTRYRRLHPVT
jgi:hypothetical protein